MNIPAITGHPVMPAKAGIQGNLHKLEPAAFWTPACAGVTTV